MFRNVTSLLDSNVYLLLILMTDWGFINNTFGNEGLVLVYRIYRRDKESGCLSQVYCLYFCSRKERDVKVERESFLFLFFS